MAIQAMDLELEGKEQYNSDWLKIIHCLFYKTTWVNECREWFAERAMAEKADNLFEINFDRDNKMKVKCTEDLFIYLKYRFDYLKEKAVKELGDGN